MRRCGTPRYDSLRKLKRHQDENSLTFPRQCMIKGKPDPAGQNSNGGEKATMQVPASFTQLLTDWRSGHPQALDRLTPLVYDELRRLARSYMRAERGGHTLQATAVVHEAFLRLVQANVALQDRAHFFALASRLMRRVLVDHAKSRSRVKRSADARETAAEQPSPPGPDFDVIALDEALQSLQQME